MGSRDNRFPEIGVVGRLDVVPVFLGVLLDDRLAALAKARDVVGRCHFGLLDAVSEGELSQ
jgi:hypothetical protein